MAQDNDRCSNEMDTVVQNEMSTVRILLDYMKSLSISLTNEQWNVFMHYLNGIIQSWRQVANECDSFVVIRNYVRSSDLDNRIEQLRILPQRRLPPSVPRLILTFLSYLRNSMDDEVEDLEMTAFAQEVARLSLEIHQAEAKARKSQIIRKPEDMFEQLADFIDSQIHTNEQVAEPQAPVPKVKVPNSYEPADDGCDEIIRTMTLQFSALMALLKTIVSANVYVSMEATAPIASLIASWREGLLRCPRMDLDASRLDALTLLEREVHNLRQSPLSEAVSRLMQLFTFYLLMGGGDETMKRQLGTLILQMDSEPLLAPLGITVHQYFQAMHIPLIYPAPEDNSDNDSDSDNDSASDSESDEGQEEHEVPTYEDDALSSRMPSAPNPSYEDDALSTLVPSAPNPPRVPSAPNPPRVPFTPPSQVPSAPNPSRMPSAPNTNYNLTLLRRLQDLARVDPTILLDSRVVAILNKYVKLYAISVPPVTNPQRRTNDKTELLAALRRLQAAAQRDVSILNTPELARLLNQAQQYTLQ